MTGANLQPTDYDAVCRPHSADLEMIAAPLSEVLTSELDGAAAALGLTSDEILVAALGRAIERTIGRGTVVVDVTGAGAGTHPLTLACVGPDLLDADAMLAGVHHALEAMTIHAIVHGAPADPGARPMADVLFANGPAAADRPHVGHLLELRAYRLGAVIALDWCFDARSFEPCTVAELAEQFPLALIALTSEATPTVAAPAEFAMAR
jgi:hypothetical protein